MNRRISLIRIGYIFLLIYGMVYTCSSQLVYTQAFTDKLNQLDLYFYEPTDDWLHPVPVLEDEFFRYDLFLVSENEDLDVRIILTTVEEKPDLLKYPHLEFTRMLTNLATNDPDADIVVSQLSGNEIQEVFNADWTLTADFIPKRSLSQFQYGRLFSLFKEDKGIASFIILSDQVDLDLIYRRILSFKKANED